MKAKDLAEILLTVPEWDVVIEDAFGVTCYIEVERNTIDPSCPKGYVQLYEGETVDD